MEITERCSILPRFSANSAQTDSMLLLCCVIVSCRFAISCISVSSFATSATSVLSLGISAGKGDKVLCRLTVIVCAFNTSCIFCSSMAFALGFRVLFGAAGGCCASVNVADLRPGVVGTEACAKCAVTTLTSSLLIVNIAKLYSENSFYLQSVVGAKYSKLSLPKLSKMFIY